MTFRPRSRPSTESLGPRPRGAGGRNPKGSCRLVTLRSVDDWPLAKILRSDFRGQAWSCSRRVNDVTGLSGVLLLRDACHSLAGATLAGGQDEFCGGPPLGELSGGNWMAHQDTPVVIGWVLVRVG